MTRVNKDYSWLGKLQYFGDDQTRLHIRPTGRRHITNSGTIFLYFHDNFLPADNVSDGKADL